MATEKRHRQSDRGFTLVELLAVIALLGILAAIAIPVFIGQREQAYLATVRADLREFAKLQAAYVADTGVHADTATILNDSPMPLSPGVKVGMVYGAGIEDRYCLMGIHEPTTLVWFFDSRLGTLMPKGTNCVPCYGQGGGGGGNDGCPGQPGDGHVKCLSGEECTTPPEFQ